MPAQAKPIRVYARHAISTASLSLPPAAPPPRSSRNVRERCEVSSTTHARLDTRPAVSRCRKQQRVQARFHTFIPNACPPPNHPLSRCRGGGCMQT
eukprot:175239-Chlamydomonas_euryale.AAC.4